MALRLILMMFVYIRKISCIIISLSICHVWHEFISLLKLTLNRYTSFDFDWKYYELVCKFSYYDRIIVCNLQANHCCDEALVQ
jgi:hypothetical protein